MPDRHPGPRHVALCPPQARTQAPQSAAAAAFVADSPTRHCRAVMRPCCAASACRRQRPMQQQAAVATASVAVMLTQSWRAEIELYCVLHAVSTAARTNMLLLPLPPALPQQSRPHQRGAAATRACARPGPKGKAAAPSQLHTAPTLPPAVGRRARHKSASMSDGAAAFLYASFLIRLL